MSSKDANAPVRMGWYGVALLVLGAFALVVAPAERRLADIASKSRNLYDLAQRNDRYVGDLASLESARARVASDVARLRGKLPGATPAVAALSVLEREAKEHHVSVASVASDQAPAATGHSAAGEGLRITFEGRYRDVLTIVADLPRHGALINVGSLSLSRAGGTRSLFPPVDASIHITIYHSPWNLLKENDRATPGS